MKRYIVIPQDIQKYLHVTSNRLSVMAKSGPRYMFGKVNNKILPAEIRIIDDVQEPRKH